MNFPLPAPDQNASADPLPNSDPALSGDKGCAGSGLPVVGQANGCGSSGAESHGDLIHRLIDSQQQLTAVEQFAQRHQTVVGPSLEPSYRDLIPLELPGNDEQYSFEVDLDACSGCKACVAACHSLNGLEEGELWRNVGLLVGGSQEKPVVQHVTAACHHCLEPACMHGCPVNAYEKDADTGIVFHLDDQCIGCKYCMFMCPYDVPSYSKSKGIVRKCNMCIDRLQVGEAPACVQACPSQAIKIRKISREELIDSSETDQLVPGAPDVQLTLPTTRYTSAKVMPRNLLPDDYYLAKPLDAHLPLVFMLTLTQMALGVFASALAVGQIWPSVNAGLLARLDVVAFGTLVLGLTVAVGHLGRPLKAYRAMAGIRTSWLSREIAGFNLFAGAGSALLVWGWFEFPESMTGVSRLWPARITLVCGVIAVACSAMLYIVTGRPLWNSFRTNSLFFLTSAVLGTSTVFTAVAWLVSDTALGSFLSGGQSLMQAETIGAAMGGLAQALILATVVKLVVEGSIFVNLRSKQFTPERHAAILLVGGLRWMTGFRFALAVVGGIAIPVFFLLGGMSVGVSAIVWSTLAVLLLLAAELIERYLFFAVSVARRMPGAPN